MIPRSSQLHGQFDFQQSAASQRKDAVRLGPTTVTATTSGTAQTLFTVDTDNKLLLGKLFIDNTTAGNITVHFMIDSTEIYEDTVGSNASAVVDFLGLPLYAGEAFKVYASATSAVVTGAAERQN